MVFANRPDLPAGNALTSLAQHPQQVVSEAAIQALLLRQHVVHLETVVGGLADFKNRRIARLLSSVLADWPDAAIDQWITAGKPLSMRLDEHGGLTELSVAWQLSKT